jgi:hypothetical protein
MCKVRVTQSVLDGLEIVRKSGRTNMLDRPVVADLAQEFGYRETAEWVRTHRDEYARGLFQGFEAT